MKTQSDPLHPASTDFCTLDYPCAYLPDKTVRMHYRHIEAVTYPFSTAVIQRGWRRFGKYFFYPICQNCTACKSLRIDVASFKPSRSQRRAMARNRDTRILIQRPSISVDHIELYNTYHQWKAEKDGWRGTTITHHEYHEHFVDGAHTFGKEALYIRDGKLVGVDLFDIVSDGISAVYFYYDPNEARRSLGTYSLLKQIEFADDLGLPYVYLGYWVDGCRSFAYKERFGPAEILDGFPPLDVRPDWQPWDR